MEFCGHDRRSGKHGTAGRKVKVEFARTWGIAFVFTSFPYLATRSELG
jgi:hypothetical protein